MNKNMAFIEKILMYFTFLYLVDLLLGLEVNFLKLSSFMLLILIMLNYRYIFHKANKML